MALKLSDADHGAMDVYINTILDAYRDGEISQLKARSDLAHAITAAAIDNEDFKQYIRLDALDKWKR
ncbi:MAG: hypothetical protein NXH87_08155 [Rhodobiaceae bacterium]|jgi:hypothetical protein|nr:hypothetical protein RHODOSMS8_01747 [Rhodobiaceae bacterium]MCR9241338.1 hypothetical protein [Rhodobiaceae bacterium]